MTARADRYALRKHLAQLLLAPAGSAAIAGPDPDAPAATATDALLALADEEDLLGLTVRALQARVPSNGVVLPARWQERISERRAWARLRLRLLCRLLHGMMLAGIDVVTLKGAALGQALFADPLVRDHHDIDLVVRPEQAHRAARWLAEEGFEVPCDVGWFARESFLGTLREATFRSLHGAMEVDLHWRLDQPWNPAIIPIGELFSRYDRRLALGDRTLRWCDPVTLARVQFTNLLGDAVPELRAIVDFAASLSVLSNEQRQAFVDIVERAEAAHILRAFCGAIATLAPQQDVARDLHRSMASARRGDGNALSQWIVASIVGAQNEKAPARTPYIVSLRGRLRWWRTRLLPGLADYAVNASTTPISRMRLSKFQRTAGEWSRS